MRSQWNCAPLVLAVVLGGCTDGAPPSDESAVVAPEERAREASVRRVALSEESAHAVGIEIGTAGAASIREVLPLYGVVKPDASRLRTISARFPGIVKSVTKNVGDRVERGERLASIESSDSLETYAITSPIAGTVTARGANPGEATGSESLFTISDLSQVWVDLTLFPRDHSRVKPGQAVRLTASDGTSVAEGRISIVGALGPADDQTLIARVPLANQNNAWTPGQFATGEVVLREQAAAVAVRSDALQTVDAKTVVFARVAGGFIPRTVTPGRSDGRFTEILAGLAAGERYAMSGAFALKAELGKGENADED
jgi:cobalt-zinc-cadmium efflux system membrane fusion protein